MRRFFTTLASFAASLMLASCTPSTPILVNLDFAKTNYGYINSGGYKAGSLLRWNIDEDYISYLSVVPGFDKPDLVRGTDRTASYKDGIGLGVELNYFQTIAINNEISKRSTFQIADADRTTYDNTITKITSHISLERGLGNADLIEEWQIREAIEQGNTYYLIVRDVTYGDSLDLSVDGEVKTSASFPIKVADASFNVQVIGNGLESIKGDRTETIFNFYVLKPYYKEENGITKLNFRVVSGVDLRNLPNLLRRVGERS